MNHTWRDFCECCDGLTLAEIEAAAGVPWGTLLKMSMDDRVPWKIAEAVKAASDAKKVKA